MPDLYLWITDTGKVHISGQVDPRDPKMVGHYLRIIADRLDQEVPEGIVNLTYDIDLLAEDPR